MTERVFDLWDRPRFRHVATMVAGLVLFLGAFAVYAASHEYSQPTVNTQPNPSPFFRDGKIIKVPPKAVATMHQFIHDAVFRKDLDGAWGESTTAVHGGLTRSQWESGTIPVTPFPKRGTIVSVIKTVESREKKVWLELLVVPKHITQQGVTGGEYFCMLVPRGNGWVVSYWGPKGWNPPIPANGTA